MFCEKGKIRKFALAAGIVCVSGAAFAHSGDPEAHFGSAGTVALPVTDLTWPSDQPVDVDRDNRLIFGACTGGAGLLGALDADGNVDASFGMAGFATLAEGCIVDMRIDSLDRIVTLSSNYDDTGYAALEVSRYLNDGSVDSSFGIGGVSFVPSGATNNVPAALTLDDKDNVYVTGWAPSPITGDYLMLASKLDNDGTLDLGFGSSGVSVLTLLPAGTEQTTSESIAVDHDGNIYVNGYTYLASGDAENILAKLTPSGTLDATFGAGSGFVLLDAVSSLLSPHYTFTQSMAIDSKGNVVLAGGVGNFGDYASVLVTRYLPNGTLDSSFNGGMPEFVGDSARFDGQGETVMIDGRDRIVLTNVVQDKASSQFDYMALRLNSDGTPDASFNGGVGYGPLAVGGRGVFAHGGGIVMFGLSEDYSSLMFTKLIGYDIPPILPPSGF